MLNILAAAMVVTGGFFIGTMIAVWVIYLIQVKKGDNGMEGKE
jgi:hypothetical protein